jgi:hypothetical protein
MPQTQKKEFFPYHETVIPTIGAMNTPDEFTRLLDVQVKKTKIPSEHVLPIISAVTAKAEELGLDIATSVVGETIKVLETQKFSKVANALCEQIGEVSTPDDAVGGDDNFDVVGTQPDTTGDAGSELAGSTGPGSTG